MITPGRPNNQLEDRLLHPQQASQEEQRIYDQVVGNVMKIIWDQPQSDRTVEVMRGIGQTGKKPWEAVGQVGHMILNGVYQRAISAGLDVDADIMINAGAETIEELMELGKVSGLFALSKDEYIEQQNKALQEAARLFAEDMGEKEFDRSVLAQEMAEIDEMEARGFDFNALDNMGDGGPVAVEPRRNPIAAGIGRALG